MNIGSITITKPIEGTVQKIETLAPFETAHDFWHDVDVREPLDCWRWLGELHPNGYGLGSYGQSNAHRAAWFIAFGPIPEGLVIRHLCHNRICCNPSHMALGTHGMNHWDSVKAGTKRHHKEELGCMKLADGGWSGFLVFSGKDYFSPWCRTRQEARTWAEEKRKELVGPQEGVFHGTVITPSTSTARNIRITTHLN